MSKTEEQQTNWSIQVPVSLEQKIKSAAKRLTLSKAAFTRLALLEKVDRVNEEAKEGKTQA